MRAGWRDVRPASQQVPEAADEVGGHRLARERRGEHRPPAGRRAGHAALATRAARARQPPARHHHDPQHRTHELRQPRRQRPGGQQQRRACAPHAVGKPLRGAGPGDVGKERDLVGGQAEAEDDRRHHEQQRRDRQSGGDVAIRGTPRVQRLLQRAPPQPALLPEPRPAVDGGEQGADGADAASRHEVDAHARFVQRMERAGVVRAVDARAGQHERCASIRSEYVTDGETLRVRQRHAR